MQRTTETRTASPRHCEFARGAKPWRSCYESGLSGQQSCPRIQCNPRSPNETRSASTETRMHRSLRRFLARSFPDRECASRYRRTVARFREGSNSRRGRSERGPLSDHDDLITGNPHSGRNPRPERDGRSGDHRCAHGVPAAHAGGVAVWPCPDCRREDCRVCVVRGTSAKKEKRGTCEAHS